MNKKFSLGLMSGTSADGLTICALQVNPFRINCFKNYPYPFQIQQKILKAFTLKAPQLSELNYELGQLYAATVKRFLTAFHLSAKDIEVIGLHGQTVYHGPHDKIPNTLQLGEPSFLAAQFGCPVISDFRAKDIALGGEGAPLIPFFDNYLWGQEKHPVLLLNIGGIANLSLVGKNIKTIGFDVGPGNSLMDLICQKHYHKPFDKDGKIAARGVVNTQLVSRLLKQSYFKKTPPKSLDKNTFGLRYLQTYFEKNIKNPADQLATASYFSAAAIAQAVSSFIPSQNVKKIIISGGGAYNKTLLHFLTQLLPRIQITTSQAEGIDPQAKESAAFALFAYLALHHKINHCAQATGAIKNTILGKITL